MPCEDEASAFYLPQDQQQTYHFLTKVAYESVAVDQTYASYQRLLAISKSAACASQVRQLLFSIYDKAGIKTYEDLIDQVGGARSRRKRDDILSQVNHLKREQTNKSFMERSTADGVMLTLALHKLSNLQSIRVFPVRTREDERTIREALSSSALSTTHVFVMILTSLALSVAKPQNVRVYSLSYGFDQQAVAIQALSMPREMLQCVSALRELDIRIATNDAAYKSQCHQQCCSVIGMADS